MTMTNRSNHIPTLMTKEMNISHTVFLRTRLDQRNCGMAILQRMRAQ